MHSMNYNDSDSSNSDESYYKQLENYLHNDKNENYKNDEHAYYTQQKKTLEEKLSEKKSDEMKLRNVNMENIDLINKLEEMNDRIANYKYQLSNIGINKEAAIINNLNEDDSIEDNKSSRKKSLTKKNSINPYKKIKNYNNDSNDLNIDKILTQENLFSIEEYNNIKDNKEDSFDKLNLRSNRTNDEAFVKSNDKNNKKDNDSNKFTDKDLSLTIHEELAKILKEYEYKINAYEEMKLVDNSNSLSYITAKACAVYKITEFDATNSTDLKLECQSFRINHNTTIQNILVSSINFWKLPNDINNYTLYFLISETELKEVQLSSMNLTLENYIKNNNNIRKPLFVLTTVGANIPNEEFYNKRNIYKNKNNNSNITVEKSNIILKELVRIFKIFTGHTNFMSNEYVEKKKLGYNEKIKSNNNNKSKDEPSFSFIRCIKTFLMPLVVILFFIFTLISLDYMSKQGKIYYNILSIRKILNIDRSNIYDINLKKNKNLYLSFDEFIEMIHSSIFNIAYSNSETNSKYAYYPVSTLRFSHYFVKPENCLKLWENNNYPKNYKDNVCYPLLYNDNSSDVKSTTINFFNENVEKEFIKINKEYKNNLSSYFYVKTSLNKNYFDNNDANNFKYFYEQTLKTLPNPDILNDLDLTSYKFTGRFGEYRDKAQTFVFSLNNSSKKVYEFLIKSLIKNNKNYYLTGGLRGFIMSFTIFHYHSKLYYHINIMYEFQPFLLISKPVVSVIPFKPDLYFGNYGRMILAFDIIRFLLSIILLFEFLNSCNNLFNKLKEKSIIKILLIFINPKVLIGFIIFIMYLVSFIIKHSSLNKDPSIIFSNLNSNIVKNTITELNIDYYSTAYKYQICLMLESLIVFLLLVKSFYFFSIFNRISTFLNYLSQSIKNTMLFIMILFFILISLSIFANNLFGIGDENFRDIPSSIMSILFITIGHSKILTNSFINDNEFIQWKCFFITIFVLFVIFIFLSSFVGLYYLSYRIIITRYNKSYDERLLKTLNLANKI